MGPKIWKIDGFIVLGRLGKELLFCFFSRKKKRRASRESLSEFWSRCFDVERTQRRQPLVSGTHMDCSLPLTSGSTIITNPKSLMETLYHTCLAFLSTLPKEKRYTGIFMLNQSCKIESFTGWHFNFSKRDNHQAKWILSYGAREKILERTGRLSFVLGTFAQHWSSMHII